jgi:hypothetical protein
MQLAEAKRLLAQRPRPNETKEEAEERLWKEEQERTAARSREMPLQIAARTDSALPEWELGERLGEGRLGTTFRAFARRGGRICIVKARLPPLPCMGL